MEDCGAMWAAKRGQGSSEQRLPMLLDDSTGISAHEGRAEVILRVQN